MVGPFLLETIGYDLLGIDLKIGLTLASSHFTLTSNYHLSKLDIFTLPKH